nr:ABC transporter substrate-binding protein [Rhodovulum imhoffii]
MGLAGTAQADPPRRVVSINLCTDQLAMLLAGPGQLLSVSRIGADPMSSPMAEVAQAFHTNSGGAEEIFLLRPDLVLAGRYSNPATLDMLRRLGVPVVQVPMTYSLQEVPDRLREVGRVLGREDRAEALIAAFETRLARIRPGGAGPEAALFSANGFTQGAGTLSHDILQAAEFSNLSARWGRQGSGYLSLEEIVMAQPDLIVMSRPYPGTSRAEELLRHPALGRFAATGRIATSGPDWTCGTPHVLDAVARLAEARQPPIDD